MFFSDYFTPLVPFYISMILPMEEICFVRNDMSITEVVYFSYLKLYR